MIPIQMELGGKDACIVCHDADIDLAAKNIVKVCATHTSHTDHASKPYHCGIAWMCLSGDCIDPQQSHMVLPCYIPVTSRGLLLLQGCHCSHELGVTIHLECCYVMQDCLQRGTGLSLCQQTDQQYQPSTVSTNTVCKATARHVTNCREVSATVGSGAQLSRWCWSWRRWLMSWSRRSTRE